MTTGLFVETYSRLKDNGVSCDACTRPTSLPRSRSANHRSCQQPGPGAAPAATAPGCRRTDLSARVRGCQGTPAAFPTATASARWQAPVPTGPVLRLSLETGGACAASVASLVPPPQPGPTHYIIKKPVLQHACRGRCVKDLCSNAFGIPKRGGSGGRVEQSKPPARMQRPTTCV